MHNATSQSSDFRLAITPGVPSPSLSALLALQRAQEPEAAVVLSEVSERELIAGLHEGLYDAGLSLSSEPDASLSNRPLWRENMAAAVPTRSPLLDKADLTVEELLDYPVFRWPGENSPRLDDRLSSVLPGHRRDIRGVTSFGLLALWVAAGYGNGISAQSRIAHAHAWGLSLRPLAGGPYQIITYLLRPVGHPKSALERFERRALQVTEATSA